MRRAPIILSSTVVGVIAVLAFHPNTGPAGNVAEAPLPALVAPQSRASGATKPTGTFLGSAVPNQYGTVQVQIAADRGRIVDVRAVQLPAGDGKSVEINRQAAPLLKQQALTAQSAQIDGVSGATYTSDGYRQSLQAALDQAALPAATQAGAPA